MSERKNEKIQAFVSWSGGKESSLSFYYLQKKLNISCLLNMTTEDKARSRSHAIELKLMKAQAKAIGLPIIFKSSTWQSYEDVFKKELKRLKKKSIDNGVFGDIDLQAHRDWVEKVCAYADIKPFLPLWQKSTKDVVREFIDLGFKAVVVCVKKEKLGSDWLGRIIDNEFAKQISRKKGVDIAGEGGEYHTFVYDGPIFKYPVKFKKHKIVDKKDHAFLELKKEKI